MDERDTLATLVREVAAGTVDPSEAIMLIERMPQPADRLIEKVFEALLHYQQDADIRAKDAAYDLAQRDGLLRLAKLLRNA